MAIRGSTVGYILVIEGVGTTSGLTALASFAPSSSLKSAFSAELGAAIDTVHEVLPSRISVGRARLEPYSAFSSDAGFTISITADNTLRQLLNYDDADPWTTSGATEVAVIDYVNSGDTAITVNSNGPFSATDLIYLNDEVMEVTGTSASDTINVSRGQLATSASDHPPLPQGTLLWQKRPSIEGSRCWLYYGPKEATSINDADSTAFQKRFQGVIQAVNGDSSAKLTIQVGALWEKLKLKRFNAPQPLFGANGSDSFAVSVVRQGATEFAFPGGGRITFTVDETGRGTSTWNYITLELLDGDAWVCLPCTQVGSAYTISDPRTDQDRQFQQYEVQGDAIAAGIGLAPVGFLLNQDELGNEWEIGAVKSCVIRRANVKTSEAARAPSALLLTILTGSLMGTLRTAEVDSTTFTILEDVLGVGAISNAYGTTEAFVIPPVGDMTIGEWLKEDWFLPLGLALVIRENGTLALMDWRDSYFGDGLVISDSTVATPRFTAPKNSSYIVASVTFETDVANYGTIDSDVAIQTSGGGEDITVRPNSLRRYLEGQSPIKDRWSATLLPQRGKSRREATFTIRSLGPTNLAALSAPCDVGSVAGITLSGFPRSSGSVPDPRPSGSGPSLSVTGDGRGIRLFEVGQPGNLERAVHGLVGPDLGDGAKWGPAATADASSATTTISIDTVVFTDSDDAAEFEPFVGYALILLDGNGTRRDTNSPLLSSQSSGSLVLAARFADGGGDLTVNSGDLIMAAPLDEQASSIRTATATEDYGWLAAEDGTLNTGSPQRYE